MASLERRLGLFSVITISISSMIGDGIFILPAIGFAATGPSLFLAFLISAICIVPAAVSKAELATAMPTSGGTYIYIERTFGPLAGMIAGLGLFMSILLKASVALVGIGIYFSFVSSFSTMPVILSFLVIICLLNIFGVGKVSSFVTFILFITLVCIATLSILASFNMQPQNFSVLFTNGIEGIAGATGLLYISFAGVTKVAAIAEEIKNPERNLPLGILSSLFLVTCIYVIVSLVLAGNFTQAEIVNLDQPILLKLAGNVGGQIFVNIIAIVAVLTMVNTSNAGILAGSRFPFAMARDKLLPSRLGKLHKKFLTPIVSILLAGVAIAVILTTLDVVKIAKLASAFKIFIFIIINIAVIVLRESRSQWYKPKYKSPFYPYIQILGVIMGVILLTALGKLSLYAILGAAIPGTVLFFAYAKNRVNRKGVIGIRGKRNDLIEEFPIADHCIGNFDIDGNAEVVVGLFGRERSAEMLVEMGVSMAHHTNIEVAHILEIPEQTDLHDVIEEPAKVRSTRRRIIAMANEKEESITYDPVMSHDVSKTVFEISQRFHCNWLLIEWAGKTRGRFTFHSPIGWLKSHLYCNLATFRDMGVRYIRKIMVYMNNDQNDKLVLSTADHLAKVYWADITLIRYIDHHASEEKRYYENSFLKETSSKLTAKSQTKVLSGKNKIETLVTETTEYDLLILGSCDSTFLNSIYGTFDDKLIARASCSVLAVHEPLAVNSTQHQAGEEQ